ncbi:MAG: D-alanine--D-alanine ligase [Firmicutes bacterium]|jgi:D-alanine-D-alanine ligase|nr:D-alanine--D-alanine ligase [Bacillota bacterium]
MVKPLRIAVLLGGNSSEREVSLRSGRQVEKALVELGHEVICVDPAEEDLFRLAAMRPDVVFIALHGGTGENGCVQGALELLGLPYTGSGVLASALAMDKIMSKQLFVASDVRTPEFITVERSGGIGAATSRCVREIGVPCVVKPACQGSTVGISIVRETGKLVEALETAFRYDPRIVVERFIAGTEVTVGVLEYPEPGRPQALPVLEIVPANEFYDYDAKYTPGKSDHIIPARISPASDDECRRLALAAHTALGCRGYSRTDLMVDADGTPWVLEVNTLPGLTEVSLLPDAAKAVGLSFGQLLTAIISAALN